RQGIQGSQVVTLERLRRAHTFARRKFKLPYPFASLNLRETGGHILHEFDEQNPDGPRLALDLNGQWELPGLVRRELEHLDFDWDGRIQDPLAVRWFPKGRAIPIVVDPHIAADGPTIQGGGVTVGTIQLRW